jgi:hypothetical protein
LLANIAAALSKPNTINKEPRAAETPQWKLYMNSGRLRPHAWTSRRKPRTKVGRVDFASQPRKLTKRES